LYREMVFGTAYYAAGADKKGKTTYAKTITKAFLDGRKLITSAKGKKLSDAQRASLLKYAAVIEKNWEQTLAEATFKYAGSCFNDLKKLKKSQSSKNLKKYIKHWGELKGFSLALQTGRKKLGETGTRLNRLIGFGPVLMNSSQVVDINSKGQYVKGQSSGIDEYMVHMLKVQKLMVDEFGVKARMKDALSGLGAMVKKLGKGESAEND